MTVSEIERAVIHGPSTDQRETLKVTMALVDLIADYRKLRRFAEGWANLNARADEVLKELRLKP